MAYGPVDLLVVGFPDNNFSGAITDEIARLVEAGTVRVLDLMFVTKDSDGVVEVLELTDLDDVVAVAFDAFVGELEGLLAEEDGQAIGDNLDPNSSAGLLLYENTWAQGFASAVRDANGEVLVFERIPSPIVEAMQEGIEA